MRRQHLTVGVDVHAATVGLLQELLKILEVVAGDHDEGTGLHGERHLHGRGRAEGLGVGAVEQLHAGEVRLAHGERHGKELGDAGIGTERAQTLIEARGKALVRVAEHERMMRIGGHTAQPEEDERLHGANVLIGVGPELGQIVLHGRGTAVEHAGRLADADRERGNRLRVEVHVRHTGEEAFEQQLVGRGVGCDVGPAMLDGASEAHEGARQLVLRAGGGSVLSADACRPRAAGAARRLLALEAEHIGIEFDHEIPLSSWSCSSTVHPRHAGDYTVLTETCML